MTMQVLLNGIIAGSTWCLVGVGFALVYFTVRFFHCAHAALFILGPYTAYALARGLGVPLMPACILATLCGALGGCVLHLSVYKPLLGRGTGPSLLLLASLAVFIVVQNVVSLVFGDELRCLRTGGSAVGMRVGGAHVTGPQLLIVSLTAVLYFALTVLRTHTSVGRCMRAVAAGPSLAKARGIDVSRVHLFVHGLGGALASVAGILVALDTDLRPSMGYQVLLPAVAVVIVGGFGNIPGVAAAGMLLGVAEHVGAAYVGAEWQSSCGVAVLIAALLLRRKERGLARAYGGGS